MLDTRFTYDMCREEINAAFNKNYYWENQLHAPLYENAVAMPLKLYENTNNEATMGGGIDDCNGEFIDGTNVQTQTEMGYKYENPKFCDEDVVYIGLMHPCYGHMITDCLAKLWYLQTDDYKKNPKPLLYISMEPLKKWQYEILELAGVVLRKLITIDDVTQYKSIVVPDNSQIRLPAGEHIWSKEFRMTVDLIICNALLREPIKNEKRIYLTRTRWNRVYDDYGEDMIEPLFRKAGYTIYSPECYTVAQQIAIMQGADEMVSTDCSSAHNAIFMRPNSKMVLLRKGLYINYYSVMISQVCKLQTIVLDCSMSILNRNGQFAYAGPFFIYPSMNLCNFLGIDRREFPYRKMRNYIKGIWRRRLVEHLIMDPVYATELMNEIDYSNNNINQKLSNILPCFIKRFLMKRLHKVIMNYKIAGLF